MTVTKNEVDQMANFMRALNPEPLVESVPTRASGRTNVTTKVSSATSDVDAMKSILQRMYGAGDTALAEREQLFESFDEATDQVNSEARFDKELRAALVTERTERGSRIGDWEIQIREDGKRKFFSVVQCETGVCIATDLLLYEAAHGIVCILNEGGRLNSKDAVALLRAEQDYAGALNNAVIYKHYLVKHPKDKRAGIFEARYSAAKERALAARNNVAEITERL